MFHVKKSRLLLIGTLVVAAGLAAACESDIDRKMRLEREALKDSGELEKLEGQLDTVNPDPYAPGKTGTKNIGRFKND
ncbi:MAG: hypothetical protein Tsb0032_28930 [Kiloniellaceae bacterium]